MKTAKEIAKNYTRDMMDSERLKNRIIDYAKQEVALRDEQWKSNFYFTKNFANILTQLPEPKFE